MDGSKWNEAQILLGSLLAQKAEHARELLGNTGLPKSGNREEIEARLAEAVARGQISIEAIIRILGVTEGWGRQHVFLYDAPDKVPVHLRSASALQSVLDRADIEVAVNAPALLVMPQNKTIRLVHLDDHKLRVEWVEARRWTERLPSLDRVEIVGGSEVIYCASKRRFQRAVSSFEWDFVNQTGELFVHRLPSGTQYSKQEDLFRELLRPIADLDTFTPLLLKRGLDKLANMPGVRERKVNFAAANGMKVSIQSADRNTGLAADADFKEMRKLIRQSRRFGAAFLNCFFEPNAKLEEEVHVHIDTFEARVGFLAQNSEDSVRHVLSTIRKASK
jgi:hypothetical protein